jgi:hypothetical protein
MLAAARFAPALGSAALAAAGAAQELLAPLSPRDRVRSSLAWRRGTVLTRTRYVD